MKRIVKVIACCLSVLLCCAILPVSAKTYKTPFDDVDKEDYYFEAVARMYEQGLMRGTSETTFSPTQKIMRGSMVLLLYRLAGSPEAVGSLPFVDVNPNAFYADAVRWAYETKIINGFDETHFEPNRIVSRQDMMVMLYRYAASNKLLRIETPSKLYFFDHAKIADYAADAIDWAKRETITNGIKIGLRTLFLPDKGITRAEAVTALDRFVMFLKFAHTDYTGRAVDIVVSYYNREGTAYSVTWHGDSDNLRFAITTDEDTAFADAQAVSPTVTTGVSGDYRYAVVLDNLTVGQTYRYRIGTDDENGGAWEIGTIYAEDPDKEEFTFGVFSDTQEEAVAYPTWGCCLQNYAKENPNASFILHCGDIVEEGGNENQWRDMLANGQSVLANTKLMLAAGNHDYWDAYTDGKTGIVADHITIDTPTQDNSTGLYYSFDRGNVHFTVLNTGDSVSSNGLGAAQLAWLKADLQSTDKLFKVIAMHNPMYSMGDYGSDFNKNAVARALRTQLNGIFEEYGVDLVLTGHDHISCATYPMVNGKPIKDGPGYVLGAGYTAFTNPAGPIHVVTPQGGHANRSLSDSADADAFLFAGVTPPDCGGYLTVQVTENSMTISTFYVNAITDEVIRSESLAIVKTE